MAVLENGFRRDQRVVEIALWGPTSPTDSTTARYYALGELRDGFNGIWHRVQAHGVAYA